MPTKKSPKKALKKLPKKALKKIVSKPKKKPLPKSLRDSSPLPINKPSTETEVKRPLDDVRFGLGAFNGVPNTPHPMVEVLKMTVPPLPEPIANVLGTETANNVVRWTQKIVDALISSGIDPFDISVATYFPSMNNKEQEPVGATTEQEPVGATTEQNATDSSTFETPYAKIVLQLAQRCDDAGNYGGTFVDRIKEVLAIEMKVMSDDMRQMIENLFNLR